MPTFPIPVFVACLLAFASLQLWRQQGRASPLVLLLILCSVQLLIIALSQHYEVLSMRYAQPITASLIPPAAWIAFRNGVLRTEFLHALGPVAAFLALLIAPQFLDVLLPGMFAVYGGLILYFTKDGADTQPNALLCSGDIPTRIWFVIGASLIASAISDVLIVASQVAGYPALRPWIISIFSVGNLLIIGVLSLSPHLQTEGDETQVELPAAQIPDPQIWERVQTYMADHTPYLDPDLTLSRLSRKMGVSAKALSSTINLATGGNVSRFINEARIKSARKAMLNGESVTNAMLLSGFNTKSNFNREFLRVVGMSPSTWLSKAQETGQDLTVFDRPK